ncbi:hypothetical protein HMPREF9398_0252 [Streptococcus sanguinis VMC66]|nr:hypothetical protein HMPREF9398_0252 [Streptococcus sanguinis VMC66]
MTVQHTTIIIPPDKEECKPSNRQGILDFSLRQKLHNVRQMPNPPDKANK